MQWHCHVGFRFILSWRPDAVFPCIIFLNRGGKFSNVYTCFWFSSTKTVRNRVKCLKSCSLSSFKIGVTVFCKPLVNPWFGTWRPGWIAGNARIMSVFFGSVRAIFYCENRPGHSRKYPDTMWACPSARQGREKQGGQGLPCWIFLSRCKQKIDKLWWNIVKSI